MPSCEAFIYTSPLEYRFSCKIVLKNFDIPRDEVVALTSELGFSLEKISEKQDPKYPIGLYYDPSSDYDIRIRNNYLGKTPMGSIEIVLRDPFFRELGLSYEDVHNIFTKDSFWPLMFSKTSSTIFNKVISVLVKVDIRKTVID